MNTLDICGKCGYQFDVREGKLEFPHPLYPTFICANCIAEAK